MLHTFCSRSRETSEMRCKPKSHDFGYIWLSTSLFVLITLLTRQTTHAEPPRERQIEFFEQRIRPVLIEQCYKCHNSVGTDEGSLALDHREAIRRGGDSGAAVVAGQADKSLLIRAIRHEDDDLRMPQDGAKVDEEVVADLVKWINDGAADPRDKAPTAKQLAEATSWDAVRKRRMQWWSFQPPRKPQFPKVKRDDWSDHPVDRFVLARLGAAGLQPANRADRRTLMRRLTFALTGLPPTPEEIKAFLDDDSPRAYDTVVDRLLRSSRFGERWARHWMDWIRYAETHGSEGDPAIPHAWRYRDYLIRALNADISYEKLLREHVAGDLLGDPRINQELGINESALGIAQYRFVQHGFVPTDALDEQVRFTDNQIDVLSKAFMGLTVSCTRCHNHKFDALSQTDFYAWYGIMASCRPALITIDTPQKLATNKTELAALKAKIKQKLSAAWLESTGQISSRLTEQADKSWTDAIEKADKDNKHPLHAWSRLKAAEGKAFQQTWKELTDGWKVSVEKHRERPYPTRWDLAGNDFESWFGHGTGLNKRPSRPGGFHVLSDGDRIVAAILPAGVYTHLISTKHNGILTSPRFKFDMQKIYVRVAGDGDAKTRYVVQNYPRSGIVYPIQSLKGSHVRWVHWDTTYWNGDHGYLETSTAADQPVEANAGATRSWFGITEAVFVSAEQVARGEVPRDEMAEFVTPLFAAADTNTPASAQELAQLYQAALHTCVEAWAAGTMSDEQVRFLDVFVRSGLLPTRVTELPQLARLVKEYRRLEKEIPVPTRAPGILEADAFDQPLFVSGNHKQPGEPVARRFLESIDARPYQTHQSGRLELANDLAGADNPFTARVAVNRIWHHLFGRGIVATTDNFGRLGKPPSHPQLLDYLAVRFVEEDWSVKQMIRLLVTSETFQLSSRASADAEKFDAPNHLLSHFRVRRLEAEAIRDALLAVSGQLDNTMYGPGVSGGSPRRSIYVSVRRNSLDPLLSVFDAPEPHTTRGRRDATNVPAQSLTLLNDPFVIKQARSWADALMKDAVPVNDQQRLRRMLQAAFGREPTSAELEQSAQFLAELTSQNEQLWQDFAQCLFNFKEFIYVQ